VVREEPVENGERLRTRNPDYRDAAGPGRRCDSANRVRRRRREEGGGRRMRDE
jgi:hypothetical protein